MRILRGTTSLILSLLMLAATVLPGCSSWRSAPLIPASITGSEAPTRVRLTLMDGRQIILRSPYISGDSLIGSQQPETARSPMYGWRAAFPLDQIAELSLEQFDAGKTALLVVGIGVTVILVAALLYNSDPPPPVTVAPPPPSCPFVYSWDGHAWRLDSGTFGGAILQSLARTDVDNLDHARPQNRTLMLKLANELDETDYVDGLEVLAVDHDPGVTIAPDGDGRLYTLVHP